MVVRATAVVAVAADFSSAIETMFLLGCTEYYQSAQARIESPDRPPTNQNASSFFFFFKNTYISVCSVREKEGKKKVPLPSARSIAAQWGRAADTPTLFCPGLSLFRRLDLIKSAPVR